MQYNLLADRLCSADRYHHAKTELLSFAIRGPRIMAEIARSNCDLVCMQELDHASDFYILNLAQLGYYTLHQPRPCSTATLEGLAISFKRNIFELLESEVVDMNQL